MALITLPSHVRHTIDDVRRRRLTYLNDERLTNLARLCAVIEEQRVPGAIVEVGCALGGSSIVIASAKSKERPLELYDVFGLIPPPSEKDGADVHDRYEVIRSGRSQGIGGDEYYGYQQDLLRRVIDAFDSAGFPVAEHSVALHKGLVQDTLHPTGAIALAHIDCDWYDSVYTSLDRIEPRLSPGGFLVIDDYSDWTGCREAVDAYFQGRDAEFARTFSGGALVVTKANRGTTHA